MELQREKKSFCGYNYYVKLPTWVANKVRLGDPEAVAGTPQELVQAILEDRRFKLFPDRVHVMVEPEAVEPPIPSADGFPFGVMFGVLKDIYGLTVAKKYEEVALFTEMLQFRGLAPVATGDPASDVFLSGGVEKWRDLAKEEYQKFLGDPGYLPVFPVPMSYVQLPPGLGPLLPTDQVKLKVSNICAGLNVPEGLIFEGSSYSGANMALRLFENDAKASQEAYVAAAEFAAQELSRILGIQDPDNISARPFLTADAIQQLGAYSQMASAGQIPRSLLHEEALGYDHDDLERQLDEENDRAVQRQIRNMRMQKEAEFKLQQEFPQPPMGPQAPGLQEQAMELPAEQQFDEFGQPVEMGGAPAGFPEPLPPPGPETGLPTSSPRPAPVPTPTGLPGLSQVSPGGVVSPDGLITQVEPEGVNPQLVFSLAQALRSQVPLARSMYLRQIAERNQRMYDAVLKEFSPISESAAKPLPEQLPPRRLDKVV